MCRSPSEGTNYRQLSQLHGNLLPSEFLSQKCFLSQFLVALQDYICVHMSFHY